MVRGRAGRDKARGLHAETQHVNSRRMRLTPIPPSFADASPVKNYLVISALGEDRPGLIEELSRLILDAGCSILDSHICIYGQECAAMLMVHGNWNTLAKLEAQLKRAETSLGLSLTIKRTAPRQASADSLPYTVEVVALEQPGIVHSLAGFFSARGINIEELITRSYPAPHTGSPMFSLNMAVGIPATLHLAMLREEFLDFCDDLNLDAVMEPVKG